MRREAKTLRGRAEGCECIDSAAEEKVRQNSRDARRNRLEDRCRRSLAYGQSTPQMRSSLRKLSWLQPSRQISLSNLTARSHKINCCAGVQEGSDPHGVIDPHTRRPPSYVSSADTDSAHVGRFLSGTLIVLLGGHPDRRMDYSFDSADNSGRRGRRVLMARHDLTAMASTPSTPLPIQRRVQIRLSLSQKRE